MYTLLVGSQPFDAENEENTLNFFSKNKNCFPKEAKLSNDSKDLLYKILGTPAGTIIFFRPFLKYLENRLSLDEVLAHSFFSNYDILKSLPSTALTKAPKISQATKSKKRINDTSTVDEKNRKKAKG